ncbi:unnamed protein product, partial [Mesorhabditis belari]|uniref:Uncharacterized protein n=1 Tax=Mesorhabditis belari TaxID=2138241 RepID=A0AAF3EPL0_9BILA
MFEIKEVRGLFLQKPGDIGKLVNHIDKLNLDVLFIDCGKWIDFKKSLTFLLSHQFSNPNCVVGLYGEKPKEFGYAPNLRQIKKIFMKQNGIRVLENDYETEDKMVGFECFLKTMNATLKSKFEIYDF